MKLILIGIRDRKAGQYVDLKPAFSIGVAQRDFTTMINDPNAGNLYKWPGDFELYELGDWDTDSGSVYRRETDEQEYAPKLITDGDSVKIR